MMKSKAERSLLASIPISPVPKWRLFLLRALYLLVVITLGFDSWTEIFSAAIPFTPLEGVAYSFWAAFSLLCVIGIRYPLKMLPLLVLQLCYKAMWLLGIYTPFRDVLKNDPMAEGLVYASAIGVVLDLLLIPWGYCYSNFVKGFFSGK